MTNQEMQTIIDTQKADIDSLNSKLKMADEATAAAEASIKTWKSIADGKDAKIDELKSKLAAIKAVVAAM